MVLQLPVDDQDIEFNFRRADQGFARVALTKDPQMIIRKLKCKENVDKIKQHLLDFDDNHKKYYLVMDKMKAWMEGLLTKVHNSLRQSEDVQVLHL